MERFAVLIDLQTIRIGANMFKKLYADLSERGSVEYLKFYNYNTKRHREFRTIIKEYGADIDITHTGKRRVCVDIRQVIDGIKIASTCANVTTIFLICSEVDALYFINEIKKLGKFVEIGVTSDTTLSDKANRVYYIDRFEEIQDEIAIACECEAAKVIDNNENYEKLERPIEVKNAKVETKSKDKSNGKRGNIFPYSDIDSKELQSKMAEIDRRILSVIDTRKERQNINLKDIFEE